MKPIYLPQLWKTSTKKESIPIEDFIPNLETLTPVRGNLTVIHGGNYLEVSAVVETIVTLTCDRCLQQYNHRLAIEPAEIIWLEERELDSEYLPLEREVSLEDLTETMSAYGYFSGEDWLYEQLSLAMPLRKLCDRNCPGNDRLAAESEPLVDRRWAGLEAFKQQLSP